MGETSGVVLGRRLAAEVQGEVHFDAATRGRYSTDASIYQMMPRGVVIPRSTADIAATLSIARDEGVAMTMRGGGTSQSGQTVNSGLIVDTSKYFNRILELDVAGRRAVVEPGIVLADLNRQLKPHGLWFPVDISTATRATIGGMTANNSCGARSLRYGTMRDNVLSVDTILADGSAARFGTVGDAAGPPMPAQLVADLLALGHENADEIVRRFPQVQRRVGGYNLDALLAGTERPNLAHVLVGSEGTLGLFTAVELRLWPLPPAQKSLGACHFPTFRAAMEAAQHIVPLKPTSVELVDSTMIGLAREIAMFDGALAALVRGKPEAILIAEFADTPEENDRNIAALEDLMSGLGFGFGRGGAHEGGVVRIDNAGLQAEIADLRAAGLNIMMSMKEDGKPVSFVEDCAVPLQHLGDYTSRLTEVFERHGTSGTWYAHASVGCLHVRPILNMKLEKDAATMRSIAEEAFAIVREYKGSHSGEHGDGIVRSEFHAEMFGPKIADAFERVKDIFDPAGVLNPGKIVRPPRMNDRSLFRYPPGYHAADLRTGFDWSAWPGASGGLQGAVEMCNNNGACRKSFGAVMCPSYRVTRDERDVTRGRANTLRLALTGQLGAEGVESDTVAAALSLCVSCKACRRECPTGVDMAKMKAEVLYQRSKSRGFTLQQRIIAALPRYAGWGRRFSGLLALRDRLPAVAGLVERVFGISRQRTLPQPAKRPFRDDEAAAGPVGTGGNGREVVLFADTFGRWFEPGTLRAALSVLTAAGYRVEVAKPVDGSRRPLCCGRTYLAAGMLDKARAEAERTLAALAPHVERGATVIGLEPSCILTMRDEFLALLPGEGARRLSGQAMLAEEFLAAEAKAGRLALKLRPRTGRALLHGHCHQKAFGAMGAVQQVLKLVPGLEVQQVESSCCGMAGAFGYDAGTIDVSLAMGELSLLPAVRSAAAETLIVADGTSCRHQIADGTSRRALHVMEVLAEALDLDTDIGNHNGV